MREVGGKNAPSYRENDLLYRCTFLYDNSGSLNILLPTAQFVQVSQFVSLIFAILILVSC